MVAPRAEARSAGAEALGPAGPWRLAFFGGGTGGHLMPGLALIESLRERHPGAQLTLFRTARAIEGQVLSAACCDTEVLNLEAPRGGWRSRWRFLRQLARELPRIRAFLGRSGVQAVVGLGGYASVPGILAARLAGVPVVLLEQNCRPGKVNKLLGPLARSIACSTPESLTRFGPLRALMRLRATGNPLRGAVLQARRWRESRDPGRRRIDAGASGRRVLVITGGSQGARALNRAAVAYLGARPGLAERIHCVHLAGNADKDSVEAGYQQSGWDARVLGFEPRLPDLLAAADLVLTRAGGTTLSELEAIGVPAVLVPYPGHRDRHQFENARRLAEGGAAMVMEESVLESGGFADLVDLLFDDARLLAMERRALALGRIDGADRVIDLLTEAIGAAATRERSG
jgi:UDP-N-acetylglucosamine--N-acetylmuramyl-(pentapeptide) pyrophosphoryl-undecaprenol N-acetylglucosamine transferase